MINTKWNSNLAYAIGLLTTDGNLSSDGRHIDLTSKDTEQLKNFCYCLKIKPKIGRKISGFSGKSCSRIQFGDKNFYNFLLSVGLMPRKSKILKNVRIPKKYFFDFLRGHFDGDGTFYSYLDPRWKSSHMFYTTFISASQDHITWLRKTLRELLSIKGHVTKAKKSSIYQLKYAKKESLKLLPKMYYNDRIIHLSRKLNKIKKALECASGETGNRITLRW